MPVKPGPSQCSFQTFTSSYPNIPKNSCRRSAVFFLHRKKKKHEEPPQQGEAYEQVQRRHQETRHLSWGLRQDVVRFARKARLKQARHNWPCHRPQDADEHAPESQTPLRVSRPKLVGIMLRARRETTMNPSTEPKALTARLFWPQYFTAAHMQHICVKSHTHTFEHRNNY